MDETQFTTVEDLQKLVQTTVEVNGHTYGIRKVGYSEYLAIGGSSDLHIYNEAASKMARGEEHGLNPKAVEDALAFSEKLLCRGLKSIKLVHGVDTAGNPIEPPPGGMHVSDFPEDDVAPCIQRILKLAGIDLDEAAKVDPTAGTSETS